MFPFSRLVQNDSLCTAEWLFILQFLKYTLSFGFLPYFLPLRTSNVQNNLNRTVITPKIFNQTYSLVTQRIYKLCIRNIWKQAADNVAPSGMDLLSSQQSLQNQTSILTVQSETLKNSATQYIVPIPMPLIVWETVIVTVSSLSSTHWSWLYLYHSFSALLLFASFLVLPPSPLAFIAIFLLVCVCVWFVFVCSVLEIQPRTSWIV